MLTSTKLVLGGAASGKSAFAETLVQPGKRVYLATAQAFDDEMRAKIATHIARRGPEWRTIECPLTLPEQIAQLESSQIALIDCVTLWLSNVMLAEHDVTDAQDQLFEAMRTCAAPLVIVSNEVGQGIVPQTKLGRTFREAQGRLNIRLAQHSDCVVHVVAGLPNILKGHLT
ncbi:MAG: bifunctional adenosylcobinamide kinase/adenosylcobinamide-phosphate guanylyltransferase [Sedimentitalea sp.]